MELCVCDLNRLPVCVCVCVCVRERECMSVCVWCGVVCVSVCVCYKSLQCSDAERLNNIHNLTHSQSFLSDFSSQGVFI